MPLYKGCGLCMIGPMSEILLGTSGFSYNDWKGEFYPSQMGAGSYLEFYSQHFSTVELNFSYYRIPNEKQISQMLVSSENRLCFVIKAYRGMTHEISRDSLGIILQEYLNGIAPLSEAGLLGGVLLQFPQSFHYTKENRQYLKALIDKMLPLPLVVEFRQKEWLRDSVYKALEELGVGFVCVDEPELPSLVPPLVITTSDIGYVRFHGRNKENWYGTDATARYDYLYSKEELQEWVPRIRELSSRSKKLFVVFNNHARAQAVTNADMLKGFLSANY